MRRPRQTGISQIVRGVENLILPVGTADKTNALRRRSHHPAYRKKRGRIGRVGVCNVLLQIGKTVVVTIGRREQCSCTVCIGEFPLVRQQIHILIKLIANDIGYPTVTGRNPRHIR